MKKSRGQHPPNPSPMLCWGLVPNPPTHPPLPDAMFCGASPPPRCHVPEGSNNTHLLYGGNGVDGQRLKKKYTYVYTCSILLKIDKVVKPFHCDTLYLYGA